VRILGKIENNDILRILLIVFLLTVIGYLIIYLDPYNNYESNFGITVFFDLLSINRKIFFSVIYLVAFPFVQLMPIFYKKENGFENLIILRITHKGYLKYCTKKIIVNYSIFIISLYASILLMIHFSWSTISFVPQHVFPLFSENAFINLILFLLSSTIGNVIFSLFLFTLIYYFKNRYSYVLLPIVLTFSSILLGILLSIICIPLLLFIQEPALIKSLAFSISPLNLTVPGILFESDGMIGFLCSSILFLGITIILIFSSQYRRIRNG
jgi:hypothetical protein